MQIWSDIKQACVLWRCCTKLQTQQTSGGWVIQGFDRCVLMMVHGLCCLWVKSGRNWALRLSDCHHYVIVCYSQPALTCRSMYAGGRAPACSPLPAKTTRIGPSLMAYHAAHKHCLCSPNCAYSCKSTSPSYTLSLFFLLPWYFAHLNSVIQLCD